VWYLYRFIVFLTSDEFIAGYSFGRNSRNVNEPCSLALQPLSECTDHLLLLYSYHFSDVLEYFGPQYLNQRLGVGYCYIFEIAASNMKNNPPLNYKWGLLAIFRSVLDYLYPGYFHEDFGFWIFPNLRDTVI
jgi:hypothetical protein